MVIVQDGGFEGKAWRDLSAYISSLSKYFTKRTNTNKDMSAVFKNISQRRQIQILIQVFNKEDKYINKYISGLSKYLTKRTKKNKYILSL